MSDDLLDLTNHPVPIVAELAGELLVKNERIFELKGMLQEREASIKELEEKLSAEHEQGRKMFEHSEQAWAMIGGRNRRIAELEEAIRSIDCRRCGNTGQVEHIQFATETSPTFRHQSACPVCGKARSLLRQG